MLLSLKENGAGNKARQAAPSADGAHPQYRRCLHRQQASSAVQGQDGTPCCAISQRHASAPKSAHNMSHTRIAKQSMLYAMHLHCEEDFFRCHSRCLLNSCSVLAIIFNSSTKVKSEASICHLRACDEGPGRSSIRAEPGHLLLEWIVGRSSLRPPLLQFIHLDLG